MAQVFSCEFCEISQNTFFIEHLLMNASTFSKDYILNLFVNSPKLQEFYMFLIDLTASRFVRSSYLEVLLKILQNSPENKCGEILFWKICQPSACNMINIKTLAQVFFFLNFGNSEDWLSAV